MILLVFLLPLIAPIVSAYHHDLSERELHHIFGVKRKEHVSKYWIDHPWKGFDADIGHHYTVNFEDDTFRFQLRPNVNLLSDNFHSVITDGDKSNMKLGYEDRHCVYSGHSLSHNGTSLALVGCGGRARGLIMTADGSHYLLHPVLKRHTVKYNLDGRHAHIIHKRAAVFSVAPSHSHAEDEPTVTPCLFDAHDDPYPEDSRFGNIHSFDEERLAVNKGPFTIELGVFADDAMWTHFREIYGNDADAEMQRFILATANNIHLLYGHRTIEPKLNIIITRYEVMKTPPALLAKDAHDNGEVDRLLEGFCQYQSTINPALDADPRHWDHALLFSGYDLYRGSLKSVAGYAPVKGMCSGIRSCTINEGLDFGSVFVVTHEMGHSLGMYHDGDNGCDIGCCIMSPSVGTGKTAWSLCSVREFNGFVGQLGAGLRPPNCLLDTNVNRDEPIVNNALDFGVAGVHPGQQYTVNQQCHIFHGDCWEHELRDGQILEDICEMVWCGAGEGIIRTTHPALEGTYCGVGKWCVEGACVPWTVGSVQPVAGGWAEWNDAPSTSCGSGCNTCAIGGQLRLRRSVRHCDNPAPNNGGRKCPGSAVRAIICQTERCSGPSPDQYASRTCQQLRSGGETPDLQLSGRGFQYEQAPCKIWCHMQLNNFIRTVGNFPDGTPCGTDSFCVKGECRQMACDGTAVVESSADCPSAAAPDVNRGVAPIWLQPDPGSIQARFGNWGAWREWGDCSSDCGRGIRVRSRVCSQQLCRGARQQRELCEAPCAQAVPILSDWSTWTEWSECDASCGTGKQVRQRACRGGDCGNEYRQVQPCIRAECVQPVNLWTEWGSWSVCSRSCDGGVQVRRRDCQTPICAGQSVETRQCQQNPCSRSVDTQWSAWQEWSECTVSCVGGTRLRRRRCVGGGICFGSSIEFDSCNNIPCPNISPNIAPVVDVASWLPWSSWSSCTRSCDSGLQRRTRGCSSVSDSCTGTSSVTRSCNNIPCQLDAVAVDTSVWSSWGTWRPCSCRTSRQHRYRRCLAQPPCAGSYVDQRTCVPTIIC